MAADTSNPNSNDAICSVDDCKLPDDNVSSSAWLSDWWQSAKEKSSSALEFMKRDLTEFSQVLQNDTASAVSSTTAIIKEKLRVDDSNSVAGRAKQGFSDLLQTVSGALYPVREPDDHQLVVIRNSKAVLLDKWQAELHELQCNPSTFSHEPRGPPELYEKWLEDFSLLERQKEAEEILQQRAEIKAIHMRLVPSSLSEIEFWQRYFYCVYQLQESRRAKLVNRVQAQEEFPWDEDEVTTSNDEVTKKMLHHGMSPISSNSEAQNFCGPSKDNLKALEEAAAGSDNLVKNEESRLEGTASTIVPEIEENHISPPSCDSSEKGTTSDEWEKDFDAELNDPSSSIASMDLNSVVKEQVQAIL